MESNLRNRDGKLNIKFIILLSITIIILTTLVVLFLSLVVKDEYSVTYEAYSDITVSTTLEVAEKPAVNKEGFSETFSYGEELNQVDTLICGEDIPVGELEVNVKMPDSGGLVPLIGMYDKDGNKIEDNIIDTTDTAVQIGTATFNTECKDGYNLVIGGAVGDITITQEAVVSEAIPAKDIETTMTATFNNKGYVENKECTYNGETTPCSTIETNDELEVKLEEEIKKEDNITTVTETVVDSLGTLTCFNNEELVDCNDVEKMPYYNEKINSAE